MPCCDVFFECGLDGVVASQAGGFCAFDGVQHAFVVLWHDLEDLTSSIRPAIQDRLAADGTGERDVRLDLAFDQCDFVVLTFDELVDVDHVRVEAVLYEVARLVVDVSHAAGHTSAKVTASHAEINHHTTSHVFERVIAETFDHRLDARVTNAEAFAGHPCDVGLSLSCAVEADVTGDDVFVRHEWRFWIGTNDDFRAT